MIWWQWIIGAIEFVAAWYLTTGLIDYLKHRRQPTFRDKLTEHQRWLLDNYPAEMERKEKIYRGSTPQHIADDIREKLRHTLPGGIEQGKGLDYGWWPDT